MEKQHRKKELSEERAPSIISREELGGWAESIRSEGKTIVTLNGSFDLLHAGHLYMLKEAKKQADVLIVGLNSDASIKRYKGEDRPIIPLKYRLQLLAAIRYVDFVTPFDEDTPIRLIEIIRPDVHVNGAEYGSDCVEAPTVAACGGRLHLLDRVDGLSTSDIIDKVQQLCAN
ncbi:MAG: Bifunctional protein HldE [Chlamydiia bacterium]|nr:Bifunctional protein HldE [Chlamydiia bacterium]